MKNKIVSHFYIKEAKKNSRGEAPIYLRITVNGKRSELSTNKKIYPEMWDKNAERVIGKSEEARTINSSLAVILGKIEKYFSSLDAKDEIISVDQIIAEMKGSGLNQMTLLKAFEYHISKLKELSGIEFAPSTIEKYGYSFKNLNRFIKEEYKKQDIRLCDLDHGFIERYYTFLRIKEEMVHNSAAKNIKNLFRVINISLKNKWLISNPFIDFNCNYNNPPRAYLTNEEIDIIYNKEFSINRLKRVRDLFIFQVYTGLSFADMAALTQNNIEIGIDGKRWIVLNRTKTGTRSSIPLLPRAFEIIDNYRLDPRCISEHRMLPVCTNQRMNGYLKEIATVCGINKNLTSHLARHTFATTITLSNGVPIETVSKMLGHTNLKTTQIYSKVVDRKVAEDMSKLMKKHG